MKSARINFGIGAESEYVLEVDDTGAATRCFNPVTGQELGVGGGDDAVIIVDNGTALDKTFAEIYDLIESGTPCYIRYNGNKPESDLDSAYTYHVELMPVVRVYKYDTDYRVYTSNAVQGVVDSITVGLPSSWTYTATSSSDYPVFLRITYINQNYCSNLSNRS